MASINGSTISNQIKYLNKNTTKKFPWDLETIVGTMTGGRTGALSLGFRKISNDTVQVSGSIPSGTAAAADSISWNPDQTNLLDKYGLNSTTQRTVALGSDNSTPSFITISLSNSAPYVTFGLGAESDGAFTNAQPVLISPFTLLFKTA